MVNTGDGIALFVFVVVKAFVIFWGIFWPARLRRPASEMRSTEAVAFSWHALIVGLSGLIFKPPAPLKPDLPKVHCAAFVHQSSSTCVTSNQSDKPSLRSCRGRRDFAKSRSSKSLQVCQVSIMQSILTSVAWLSASEPNTSDLLGLQI